MKKIIYKTPVKVILVVLTAVLIAAFAAGLFFSAIYLTDDTGDCFASSCYNMLKQDVSDKMYEINETILNGGDVNGCFDTVNSNVRYRIIKDGAAYTNCLDGEEYYMSFESRMFNDYGDITDLYAVGYVLSVPKANDEYLKVYKFYNVLEENLKFAPALTAAAGVLCLILFITIMSAAGRKPDTDEITVRFPEKIPLDIFAVIYIIYDVLAVRLLADTTQLYYPDIYRFFVFKDGAGVFLAALALILILLCAILPVYSFGARVKKRGWIKNCLAFYILKWIYKALAYVFRKIKSFFSNLSEIINTALAVAAWEIAYMFLLLVSVRNLFPAILLLFLGAAGGAFVIIKALRRKNLLKAAEHLASGELDYRISTEKMFGDDKKHGEYLNSIGEVITSAVDTRLKSERLKTELITNVSHDLKTPLTSIVNYSELLEKQNIGGDAEEYIKIISSNALRLKKLTDDLLEASKASSGNINVSIEPLNLCELINQAEAEYSEKFAAGNLEIVTETSSEKITVMSDGRCLWRIIDNLLGNACKYSLPGTRVYLTVRTCGEKAEIELKNISRDKLNISPSELTERFVRGDKSRNTEGSGLGLSIASGLSALIGGKLSIIIDGDLFKAEIELPLEK